MDGQRATRPTTRLLASVATCGLLMAGAVVVAANDAGASGTPNLSIKQVISGSSTSGHATVTVTVKNLGSATASQTNVELLTTTKVSNYALIAHSIGWTCQVMPAPAPYSDADACQHPGTIEQGAATALVLDVSGKAKAAFTQLVEVGDLQGDSNYKNNSSTIKSYFGPAVDLAVAGKDKVGTKHGHTTAAITVVNRGPNDAQHLQVVSEFTGGTGALATGGGSCQIVPAANGYTLASSCVFDLLKTGKVYKVSYDIGGGTSGHTCKVVTTVSSFGTDPNTKNNKITRTSKFK